jgi:hypothetical protein
MRFPRSFTTRLALAVAAGLAVRVLYVVLVARKIAPFGDAVTYHGWAQTIADGIGWVRVPHPELGLFHVAPEPSAEHGPLFSLVLAGFYKLGVTGWTAQKVCVCGIGASTIVFTALAAREAAGARCSRPSPSCLCPGRPVTWRASRSRSLSRPTPTRCSPAATAALRTTATSPACGCLRATAASSPATSRSRHSSTAGRASTTRATTRAACRSSWRSGWRACGISTARFSRSSTSSSKAAAAGPRGWAWSCTTRRCCWRSPAPSSYEGGASQSGRSRLTRPPSAWSRF